MDNKVKTMICVLIAGLLFIMAVGYDIPYLVLIGAFFDWLPLPTGWMRFGGGTRKQMIKVHAVVTLIAYAFAAAWLLGAEWSRVPFLEVWWVAVIAGVAITL